MCKLTYGNLIIIIIIIIIIGTTAPFEPRPSSEASVSCPSKSGHCFSGFCNNIFSGAGCQPYVQPPAILEDRLDCFLVWVFVTDQSSMAGPTSSFATASIAPWLVRPHKPTTLIKVLQSVGGDGNLIRGGKSDSLLGNTVAEVCSCVKYTCQKIIQRLLSIATCSCIVCDIFHSWDFSYCVISDTIRMCLPACTCHMQYVMHNCDLITLLLSWVMCMIVGDRTGILYCSGLTWMGRSKKYFETVNVWLTKMNRVSNYSKLL